MSISHSKPVTFLTTRWRYTILEEQRFAPPNDRYNFKKSISNIISHSSSVVEYLAVTLKVSSSNLSKGKTFF